MEGNDTLRRPWWRLRTEVDADDKPSSEPGGEFVGASSCKTGAFRSDITDDWRPLPLELKLELLGVVPSVTELGLGLGRYIVSALGAVASECCGGGIAM